MISNGASRHRCVPLFPPALILEKTRKNLGVQRTSDFPTKGNGDGPGTVRSRHQEYGKGSGRSSASNTLWRVSREETKSQMLWCVDDGDDLQTFKSSKSRFAEGGLDACARDNAGEGPTAKRIRAKIGVQMALKATIQLLRVNKTSKTY